MTPVSPVETALALSARIATLEAQLAAAQQEIVDLKRKWHRESCAHCDERVGGHEGTIYCEECFRMYVQMECYDALAAAQQQAAESAALAERMREHLHVMVNMRDKLQMQAPSRTDEQELFLYGTTIWQTARELSCYPPLNCLAEYRERVLEEVAQMAENDAAQAKDWAEQSRHIIGHGYLTGRAEALRDAAKKIRAMKGTK